MKTNRRGNYPPDLPADGWEFVELLGARETGVWTTCQWCGTAIRWVHFVRLNAEHVLGTGCCCAARLVYGYDARTAERDAANRVSRLQRFTNLAKWRSSKWKPNNLRRKVTLTKRWSWWVTIFENEGGWKFVISRGDEKTFSSGRWPHRENAMHAAFEAIERLRASVGEAV